LLNSWYNIGKAKLLKSIYMENTFPKWLVSGLGALLIAFVALLIIQQGYNLKTLVKNQKPANTISVSAEGKIKAVPDLATVNIGVMTQGNTAAEVKDGNNTKINKIIEFVKAQGISAEDIKTSQFSFYPQQNWQNGKGTIIGYQGDQTITVKVKGVDKSQTVLEKILDGSVNSGANQIQGVNFGYENPENVQQEARKLAIDNAKTKAQGLAKEAGLTLGKVVSIAETGSYMPGIMSYADSAYGMGGGGVAMQKSLAPNVEPGSQEITESMTVVFEVK
jgi:uncharacterized protein YggE